jgi:hypothetical protein
VKNEMPKQGYRSVTLRNDLITKIDTIAKELHKSIPDTIEYLTDLFSQYTDVLKVLNSPDKPKEEDIITLAGRLQKKGDLSNDTDSILRSGQEASQP